MSLVLAGDSRAYIAGLRAYRDGRIEDWSLAFARAAERAAGKASELGSRLASLQGAWRERAGRPRRHSSAEALIQLLPAYPIITLRSAAEILQRSRQAANEAIALLAQAGVLRATTIAPETGHGRRASCSTLSTRWNASWRRLPTSSRRGGPRRGEEREAARNDLGSDERLLPGEFQTRHIGRESAPRCAGRDWEILKPKRTRSGSAPATSPSPTYARAMPLAWVLFDWGDTLMSEDGPADTPMALWPEVRVIDGAAAVLAALAPRYRIAVATNATVSDRTSIRRALARVARAGAAPRRHRLRMVQLEASAHARRRPYD